MLCDRNNSGSALITIVRIFPPNGGADTSPGMVVKEDRTYVFARSSSSLLLRVLLLNTSSPTGNVEASKRMIKGGWEPGGKIAWALFANALSSAAAWAI